MTITPDQARNLLDGATLGPWDAYTVPAERATAEYTAVSLDNREMVVPPRDGGMGTALDSHLIAAAPDLAQTIAGMTEEWGVERDRPGTAYIDGTVARWITWIGDEARARKACVISPRGGNPRLVRRLVGPAEVVE